MKLGDLFWTPLGFKSTTAASKEAHSLEISSLKNEHPEKLLESKILSFQAILCMLCTDDKLNEIALNVSTLGKLLSPVMIRIVA
jgi:hypothetical protein